jgi:uncharacterized membrane protein
MALTPRLRKLALAAHVTSSVGWFGAVAVFLALALAGLTSKDGAMVRAAYLVMGLTGWFVIVPLCFASLLTGIALSLGTSWGLFRYYWVLAKLLMTVPATLVLLAHMQPIDRMASVAESASLSGADLHGLQAAAALVVLLVATVLSVYKPKGMTRYGWRRQNEQRTASAAGLVEVTSA